MNTTTLIVSVGTLAVITGTVWHHQNAQESELQRSIDKVDVSLRGFDELKNAMLADIQSRQEQKVAAQRSVEQFMRAQTPLPSNGYGKPLETIKW